MPWWRCTLDNKEQSVEITIDLLVDQEGHVDRALTFYGYFRNLDNSGSYPFALDYSGLIDWGSASSYVSTLPIRGARIGVGSVFPYREFPSRAAQERAEAEWHDDFFVKSYRNYAE